MSNGLLVKKMITRGLCTLAALCCLLVTTHANAFTSGEDDTILVESAPDKPFSYSTAIKAFSKRVLHFDVDEFFTGGQNCKDAVVRNFSQLAERTRYKFNLKHDQVEVKFTLNF